MTVLVDAVNPETALLLAHRDSHLHVGLLTRAATGDIDLLYVGTRISLYDSNARWPT